MADFIKIISVIGARPNFIKVSPFIKEIEKYNQINSYGDLLFQIKEQLNKKK